MGSLLMVLGGAAVTKRNSFGESREKEIITFSTGTVPQRAQITHMDIAFASYIFV